MLSTEVIERILTTATRAPSVHNTQPWQVSAHGDVIEVRRDPARCLRHSDPGAREATISCGALVDHVVVAARREGLDAQVALLPEGADGRLARIRLTAGPAPTAAELELSVAAVHRRTSRTALDDLAVDDTVVQSVQAVAAAAHAHLVLLPPSSAARQVVLRQVARAEALAGEDRVGIAEEQAWTGSGEGRTDGLPVADPLGARPGPAGGVGAGPVGASSDAGAGADAGSDAWDGAGATAGDAEGFDGWAESSSAPAEPAEPSAADETVGSRRLTGRYPAPSDLDDHGAVLALLTTPGDSLEDWLEAGRALSRVLLVASVHGLTVSFATTVLENPTTRHEVVRSLGLVAAPQMLVQLGYGEPGLRSPRRAVAGVDTVDR